VRLECDGKAWRAPRSETEQRLKGGHRLLPPIVSKDKLIEIDLELSAADTVISADQPLLEVADRAVGQRHHGLGTLAQIDSQRLRARDVFVPASSKPVKVFRPSCRSWSLSDVLLDECAQRDRLKVWDHTMRSRPEALSRFSTATNTGPLGALELSASAQTCLGSANPGVVDLHLSVERLAPPH